MYDDDEIIPVNFKESIRKRPGMYLGHNGAKGIINLISGVLKECIKVCDTDEFVFTVSILGDNSFSLDIDGKKDLSPFIQLLIKPSIEFECYYMKVLLAISETLELLNDHFRFFFNMGNLPLDSHISNSEPPKHFILNFSIDKSVINDTEVDYLALNEELILIPILNRKVEIILKDLRWKYLNQNYYNFPNGVFYVFDRIKIAVAGHLPKFEIKYEATIGENRYQIAIAYRPVWTPAPSITSFANDLQTIDGGSLVDGVIDGLALGCRKYIIANGILNHVVKKKKLFSRLILVCAVRGGDFDYRGSFKETLESKQVLAQARKVTRQIVFDYLLNNTAVANEFLFRFDITKQFL